MSGEKVYFLWNNDGLVWGTADYVWSAAVWDTQTTNLSATGSIGERLKNASTVDTTAATVAAYDI